MTKTILQKIDAEEMRIRAEIRSDIERYKEFPVIRAGGWQIKYPIKQHNEEYNIIYSDGPVTLNSLREIVEELKADGIKEAHYEAEYRCYQNVDYRIGDGEGLHGDYAQVDLAPLFD